MPGLAFLGLLLLALLLPATAAHGSVSILLEQPYGEFGFVNPSGHAAVYLDHVCADGPLRLRPCQPGEMGVVLSRYDGIGTWDWIAMPVIPYLYAVDTLEQVPSSMDRGEEIRLRDLYRRANLELIAPDDPSGQAPEGNWYQLVGAAYDRTIYGFRVKTTAEQDARLIELFNDRPNRTRYNGAFTNCADFVRVTINRFYPHAIRRNFIADLGMTAPKSVARGLSHYARHHPEAGFDVFVIPQVKGSLPRSRPAQGFSESLIRRYGIPLTLLSPGTAAVALVAYVGQGRFAMPKNAPVLELQDSPGADLASAVAPPVSSSVNGGAPFGWRSTGMMLVRSRAQ